MKYTDFSLLFKKGRGNLTTQSSLLNGEVNAAIQSGECCLFYKGGGDTFGGITFHTVMALKPHKV
jgi:hypothetical protein